MRAFIELQLQKGRQKRADKQGRVVPESQHPLNSGPGNESGSLPYEHRKSAVKGDIFGRINQTGRLLRELILQSHFKVSALRRCHNDGLCLDGH